MQAHSREREMWGKVRKGKAEGFKRPIGKQQKMWGFDTMMYIQNTQWICAQLRREDLDFRE